MTTETIEGNTTEQQDAAAEQAAAQAAFSQARTGETPAEVIEQTEAPAKTAAEIEADEKAESEAQEKEAEQRWLEGAPKSVRESLTAISGVTGRLRNIEGHIGGLKHVTNELRTAMTSAKAEVTAAGGEAPTDTQVAAAKGDMTKWNAMKEDFPEWWEAMEQRLQNVKGGGQVVDLDAVRNQVRAEVASEMQVDFLDTHRDGWQETLNKQEFKDYVLDGGPSAERFEEMKALDKTDRVKADALFKEVQQEFPDWWKAKGRAFFSEKAKDAIKLLDGFEATSKTQTPADVPARNDNKARLEAAVAPTKANSRIQSRETITEEEAAKAAFNRVRTGS